ncbi:sigma-70 family RNA polymerase sigma factor [Verrucomicrobiota bacterium sgz303538]
MKTRHVAQSKECKGEGSVLASAERSDGERIDVHSATVTTKRQVREVLVDMSEFAPITDAELLQNYEKGSSESAFTALVERYQTMVLGTALRKTGNLELAREIAQEVFAALARKARFLNTRASIGGWLHQATIYQAARTLQSEARRHARHERFAEEAPQVSMPVASSGTASDHLAVIDEALGLLSAADREVIVLHYFQDLSYPEIAKVLGVNEPAVRQRVSRALERLGKRLREQGVTTNVVVLLLGAVAVQSTIAAPVGLASAAIATAAAGGGFSAYLLLTAFLSQGAIKTATVVLALAGMAAFWHEAPVLYRFIQPNGEGSEFQISDASYATLAPVTTGASLTADVAPNTAGQPVADRVATQRQALGVAASQLNGKVAQTPATASRALQTVPSIPSLTSPPSIADLPSASPAKGLPKAASAKPGSNAPNSSPGDSASPSDPLPSDPDFHFPGVLGEIAEIGGLPAVVDELRRVELIPHEAAKLYGELLGDVLSLEPGKRTLVEGFLEDHFEQLNKNGIAGVRPPQIAEESWRVLRDASITDAVEGVGEILSDVAPDPKVIDGVFALVEKPTSDGSTAAVVGDLVETVNGVGEAVSALPEVITPVKLPLLR